MSALLDWTWRIGAVIAGLAVLGMVIEGWARGQAAKAFSPPGHFVEVEKGRDLHILCKGDAPGPTVILEMGAAEPSSYWWPMQDRIAAFARVCTYDRAGFGWSDPPRRRQSLEDRARDLHALLSKGKVPGPYVLVGHSYGGPLVRLFARDHPELVAGMVLVDTPDEASMFRKAYVDFTTRTLRPMVTVMGVFSRLGLTRLWGTLFPDKTLPPIVRRALSATRGPAQFRAIDGEFASIMDAPENLRRPGGFGPVGDKPLIVITHGQKFPPPFDVLEVGWDEGQARLTALSPQGELIVAHKSNHMIHFDEPELVAGAIRRVFEAARDGHALSAVAPQTASALR